MAVLIHTLANSTKRGLGVHRDHNCTVCVCCNSRTHTMCVCKYWITVVPMSQPPSLFCQMFSLSAMLSVCCCRQAHSFYLHFRQSPTYISCYGYLSPLYAWSQADLLSLINIHISVGIATFTCTSHGIVVDMHCLRVLCVAMFL